MENEIEKSYKGLLATIFGVAHQKSDEEINRPPLDSYDLTYEDILLLKEKLEEQKKHQRPKLRVVPKV